MVSILATVERGIAAGAAAEAKQNGGKSPWPPESYTSRRNPKQFALAEVTRSFLFFAVQRSGTEATVSFPPYARVVRDFLPNRLHSVAWAASHVRLVAPSPTDICLRLGRRGSPLVSPGPLAPPCSQTLPSHLSARTLT